MEKGKKSKTGPLRVKIEKKNGAPKQHESPSDRVKKILYFLSTRYNAPQLLSHDSDTLEQGSEFRPLRENVKKLKEFRLIEQKLNFRSKKGIESITRFLFPEFFD
ncbi:MAG: hypothetical protein Q8P11_01670 [bacterium]|nr:hypothetical protein [bacterium]